jgi:cysteine desulfuration protein SufE
VANYSAEAKEIIQTFQEVPDSSKLELLLEFADGLPDLPDRYANHPELLERVEECQSPVYLFVEVDDKVHIYLTAPKEAPTTRGFAAILQQALDKLEVSDVLNFDDTFVNELGLTSLVSPLRIHGMHGMLNRIKRQTKEKLDAR